MTKVTASAPGKLMLFGEHAVVYGHPCVVTAVSQRVFVSVLKLEKNELLISAPDVGVIEYSKKYSELGQGEIPRGVIFLEKFVQIYCQKYPGTPGLKIETKSEFSSQFGFGSSSAVTVALAAAVAKISGVKLTNKEMFDLCYETVIAVQGVGSGFDIAAAIWGGTLYYIKPAKVVEVLTDKVLPIVVGYSGIKADTSTLVRAVEKKKEQNPELINHIFDNISKLVESARVCLESKNWYELGKLMQINQSCLDDLGVSIDKLDTMIEASVKADAYGAKLSGAGGGDCIIALCSERTRNQVEKGISSVGGQVVSVSTGAPGVRIENI